MQYHVQYAREFKRQYKKLCRSGQAHILESLDVAMKLLVEYRVLPISYHPHTLFGTLSGCFECHVRPDWLLIYRISDLEKILEFVATGTHASLFE